MNPALRWLGATVAAAVAVAVCVALGQLAYQFFETYGPDRDAGWDSGVLLSAVPFVFLAALAVAGAAAAAFALAGRPARGRGLLALAGLSLVLTAGVATAGAWLGTDAKQQGQQRAAAACSAEERQVLQTLDTVPNDGVYGTGMQDGSCQGFIAFVADAQADARLAAVRDSLTAQGWVAQSQDEQRATYRKGDKSLELTVVRNKAVEVTLSLT